jgi:hypothetical protein
MVIHIGLVVGVAPGDVRALRTGDTIILSRDAYHRPDWARYWDAIHVAFNRGANLRIIDE